MTIEGVDLSFARPGGKALAAAGKRFVVRYLEYSHASAGSSGKFLTSAEVADYRGHGLALVANFESTSTRALDGHAAGVADGNDARVAMGKLGFPSSCPVYFSVDFDAQPSQQATIDAYLGGAASVLGKGRVGVYGSYSLVTRCRANGSATWWWQTYAWSGGKIATFAHIHQYLNGQAIGGGAVDFDAALKANYGQWDPPPGAGPAQPVDAVSTVILTPGPSGKLTPKADPAIRWMDLATGKYMGPPSATFGTPAAWPGIVTPPFPGGRNAGFQCTIDGRAAFFLAENVTFTPTPGVDCTAAIAAATAPLQAKIAAAQKVLT